MIQPGSGGAGEPGAPRASTRAYAWMIGLGLVLALLGGLMMLSNRTLEVNGARADGVVTGFERERPTVAFTDGRGTRRIFTAGSNKNLALSEGERVRVIYDPRDPALAAVDSFGSRSLVPWSFTIFGLLVSGLGLASILKLRQIRE